MPTKRILLSLVSLCIALNAFASLSVKQPCSDGMVLQQKSQAVIWGHASSGSNITVTTSWNGKSYKAKTDSEGTWKVQVQTPEASYKHHEVKVSGDGGTLTIKDVLIGEVWMASGQSNMEMPLRGFFNCPVEGANEIAALPAMEDRIRMFTVEIEEGYEPFKDVKRTSGWKGASPSTVLDMSATAYFFASQLNATLDVPVGIVAFPRGGARVEGFLPKETVKGYGTEDVSEEVVKKDNEYHKPYVFYNGMEQPIAGYTAKGFIWYQGCSNVGEEDAFVPRMTDLVAQFRKDWGDTECSMPFYQVEIAPYRYTGGQKGKAAALRDAQHKAAVTIPNSAIVVTNDLAYSFEVDQIHPRQKKAVGQRLAFLALNRDYGFSRIACYSPEAVEAFRVEGNSSEICVKLSNCPNGTDKWQEIQGLEVCGSEGTFKPVKYAYYEWGGYLRIRCEDVFDPCEVRYGYGDFVPGNLHNVEGLPVAPFDIKIK